MLRPVRIVLGIVVGHDFVVYEVVKQSLYMTNTEKAGLSTGGKPLLSPTIAVGACLVVAGILKPGIFTN